jgi:hypothetical protein
VNLARGVAVTIGGANQRAAGIAGAIVTPVGGQRGAAGTSLGAPGTNSSGTALSSGGVGEGAVKGAAHGTGDPAVDREDQKAAWMVQSICKGCQRAAPSRNGLPSPQLGLAPWLYSSFGHDLVRQDPNPGNVDFNDIARFKPNRRHLVDAGSGRCSAGDQVAGFQRGPLR